MSSSITLKVNDGEGLSYAIDRALDEQLGDVTLSKASQWQSIFSIITREEQAEQHQKNQKQQIMMLKITVITRLMKGIIISQKIPGI